LLDSELSEGVEAPAAKPFVGVMRTADKSRGAVRASDLMVSPLT
jgi:hypothetical protein